MQSFIRKFDSSIKAICAGLLFIAMMITFLDVGGRSLFGRPIAGAFEVSELLLASLVYMSMPLASRNGAHISIDLLSGFLTRGVLGFSDRIANLLSAAFLLGACYLLWFRAVRLREDGLTTAVLQIPVWPVVIVMSVAIFLMAVIHLYYAVAGVNLMDCQPPVSDEPDDETCEIESGKDVK